MSELNYQLDMLKKPVWKFVNAGQFAKDNLLYIQESGKFCSGKNYFTIRKGLDSYLIKITLSGKGILEYCGEKYDILPESVMFIDCNNEQNYRTDVSQSKWEMIWVHFYGAKASAYYNRFTEKNNSPVAMLSDSSIAVEIIENIIALSDNYGRNAEDDLDADYLITSLLNECIKKSGNDNESPDYINRIARYIRQHYSEEITLDYLSRMFNISKYHLQRKFKEKIGLSPAKYLSSVRINRAKSLLRGTDLSVSEIAEHIGMDTNYFIQIFKGFENITPKQYRIEWCGTEKH